MPVLNYWDGMLVAPGVEERDIECPENFLKREHSSIFSDMISIAQKIL